MGDRLLMIQDDFETMQRLMNELVQVQFESLRKCAADILEYEKKQYENEIEKELQLIAELDSKTEATKQEDKLNKEEVKQQDEEAILLDKQCVQDRHNYSSLKEACDILSEQEKNLSRSLRELKIKDETAREKRKATVDRYDATYKSYKEKYEKHSWAVKRREKAGELANWEANYNEAKLIADETAKKLERTASHKAVPSVSEFPIFKNQNEFIIRLAEMKLTFDGLFTELERKTDCYEELKKTIGEKVKARRHMEEEKKKDDLKRIANERASDERDLEEKRMRADVQRQEEKKQYSGEQRRKMEERQVEDQRLKKQMQSFFVQVPFQRPETTTASQPPALQASTAFHQRLPPKIFMPGRQMSFQSKQDNEEGVFRAPLPPKDMRHPVTATGKRLQYVDSPIANRTLPPCHEATAARPRSYSDALVEIATTTVQPKHVLYLERRVEATTPVQPKQPSCTETSSGVTVLPRQARCPEVGGGIINCLENLSIRGQTDRNVLMETEDKTLPSVFNISSVPPKDSTSAMLSGFNQCSGVETGEDTDGLMLSNAATEEQESTDLIARKEHCLEGIGAETPMTTDQEDQLRSLEATASAAVSVGPEISVNVSDAKNNCRPLHVINDIPVCHSIMCDDPVGHSTAPNADCVVSSPITRSVCSPSGISSSPGSLVLEAAANEDRPTLPVTSSATYPTTAAPSDVHLYCPTSEMTTMTSLVSGATSVASAVTHYYPTASMSAAESEFGTKESPAKDFTKSLEQPSGWAIGGTRTPVIRIAEKANVKKFIGNSSPVEFNFENEMAKLKELSKSPAPNLYSQRRMFIQSDQSEDQSASVCEPDGMTNFMCNFESARQSKESDKATNPDFHFGNLFAFSDRSISNEVFNFFGSRGNEAESSSKSGKDGATASDDIFKLFGGSDAENTTSRKKETVSDVSDDIFNMFPSSGNATASSSKNTEDDAGGFFNFGSKSAKDGPPKSQFKFF